MHSKCKNAIELLSNKKSGSPTPFSGLFSFFSKMFDTPLPPFSPPPPHPQMTNDYLPICPSVSL